MLQPYHALPRAAPCRVRAAVVLSRALLAGGPGPPGGQARAAGRRGQQAIGLHVHQFHERLRVGASRGNPRQRSERARSRARRALSPVAPSAAADRAACCPGRALPDPQEQAAARAHHHHGNDRFARHAGPPPAALCPALSGRCVPPTRPTVQTRKCAGSAHFPSRVRLVWLGDPRASCPFLVSLLFCSSVFVWCDTYREKAPALGTGPLVADSCSGLREPGKSAGCCQRLCCLGKLRGATAAVAAAAAAAGRRTALRRLRRACRGMQGWMRVLLGSKQKKVLQGVIAVLGDNSTSLRSKENAAWILRRVTELSDTAKTQFGGYCSLRDATGCSPPHNASAVGGWT